MKLRSVELGITVLLLSCLIVTCKNETPTPTYTVMYYGNGSTSGKVSEQSALQGSTLYISDGDSLSYKCHSFTSWNTSRDGSGKTYNPGDEYRTEGNLVLFAQWNESHDWAPVERQEATCSQNGWKEYRKCRDCGARTGYEELTAEHSLVTREGKASTCSEQGWESYEECTRCGYSTKILLPYAEHSLTETVKDEYLKTPATCTDKAVYYKSCSVCGASSDETFEYGTALGHDIVSHVAKSSTCEEQGWNAYETCTRCTYSTRQLLPLADHTYINRVDDSYLSENATCSKEAVYYKSCSVCGAKSGETFNSGIYLNHDLVSVEAKEPTCTEKGWNAYSYCTRCDYTSRKDIDAKEHDEIKHEGKASTCQEQGWNEYVTCSRCSYTTQKLLPLADHSYTEAVQEKYLKTPATCTDKAVYYKSCSICGAASDETFEYGTALGHDIVSHAAKASTCEEQGWNAYETCTRCTYSTRQLLPLADHTYINKVDDSFLSENATCSKEAVYYKSCSICGAKSTETFSSGIYLEHDLVRTDEKTPTCTSIGWDAYDSCTRCDYTTYHEKAALGHNTVSHEAKAATCTDPGYKAYDTCTRCSYTTYSVIPAEGHAYVKHDAKTPTCTDIGWNEYSTCSKCDYTTFSEKSALGHDLVSHEGKAPTCTESGYNAYNTCSRCDYTTYSVRPADGHINVTKEARASTCSEQGWNSYEECTVCGNSTKELLPLLSHSLTETVKDEYLKTPATCTAKAVYYKSCSVCGAKSEETFEYGTALGHDMREYGAKQSTCLEQGWNAYEACTRCTESTRELLPLSDHDYIEKIDSRYIIENATCSEDAVYYKSCSVCGKTSEETFRSGIYLEHELIHHEAKSATCEEIGWDAYDTCSRCDYTTYHENAALGHDIVSHEAKAATCTEKGYRAYDTCTRCDYSTYSEAESLGHDYEEHVAKTPTCTEIGWNAYRTCSRCDYTTYSEKTALGHDYLSHEAKEPTCTSIGWNAYSTCSRCDFTDYVEIKAKGHSYSSVWTTDTTYHWHKATCEHTDLVSDKAEHAWNSDNECTVCGIKNAGSGGITIDPAEYTLSLTFPEDWNGSLHVVPSVKGTVKAALTPSDENTEYAFFLDGTVLTTTGDELVLGNGDGKVELTAGYHVLIIMAELDGNTYQNRYVIQVSESGTGTVDTEGKV